MYRIAHLACILAAATLCSGAAVEPRGDIRYDLPGSNLKEASISQPSASGHNRGVTKDRRDYDRRDSGRNLKETSISQPSLSGHNRGVTKDRRDYDRRDYRLSGGAGGDPHRQEPPHSTLHRRVYPRTQSPPWGISGGQAPRTNCSGC